VHVREKVEKKKCRVIALMLYQKILRRIITEGLERKRERPWLANRRVFLKKKKRRDLFLPCVRE
jgi:hypothetical protein